MKLGNFDFEKYLTKECLTFELIVKKPKMAYSRDAFIETREDREGLQRERE